MSVAEISVVPIGTSNTSVSRFVVEAVRVLHEEANVKYELTAMGTIIEGDTGSILNLAGRMHESAFKLGAKRVVTTIKIDDRRDKPLTISGKIDSVKKKLR